MGDKSSRSEEIVFAALELSVEQRADFLEEACGGDAELRARIEKMLKAAPNISEFLEQPFSDQDGKINSEASHEGPGTQIGPYKLLQEIGEGGFGVVYMAEQIEPIRRLVALKIIKPGMDSREVIARFEAERQALALMDHTSIARVYDAGTAENGRPYFAMELVKGVPITEFCDKNSFSTNQRLALFTTVCRAVQHAHQKGVIHRDLKPSNIMITLHDGDPVPKVIDFGVSKAISQRLTEKTLFTRYGQMVGTPQYMSPEQAEMSGLDIDTRSDVYSLGVLLYELLTGTTPLETERLRTAAYAEMVRIIQTEEPPKPSTRVSSLGDSLTVVCEHRTTNPKQLRQSMSGDLDWIVMKALDKHRDRRYETATEFARDIERHLNDEPVVAGPPSASYLLSKIVRRNKVAVLTASAIFAALVIGLAVAIWGYANASHHRGVAEKGLIRAEAAEKEAVEQRNGAREAKDAAEKARIETALRSKELARRVYVMELATVDRSLSENNFSRARRQLDDCSEDQREWDWRFLNNRYHAAIPIELPSCEQPLFTSDGARLVAISGSYDSDESKQVMVWDLASKKPQKKLSHANKIQCVALSTDDRWAVGGAQGGHVILWDMEKGTQEWAVLARRADSVDRSESFAPGLNRNVYQKFKDRFGGIAFSPDGSLIATACWDGHLRVLNRSDGSLKFDLELGGNLRKVSFSPDGRWLINGGVIVDTSNGKIVERFTKDASSPTFSPNGRVIATGNAVERRIYLWDWDGTKLSHKTSWKAANSNRFNDLRFCKNGTHLASAQGAFIAVWDMATRRKVASLDAPWGMAWWLGVNPEDDSIGFGSSDRVGIWHYAGNDKGITRQPEEEAVRSLSFSPDGKKIAMGSHRGQHGVSAANGDTAGQIVIIESASGERLRTIDGKFQGFCWLPNSSNLITTRDEDDTHVMYEIPSGKHHEFSENVAVGRPHVDTTGKVLTSVGKDFIVRSWDVDSRQVTDEFSLGHIWGSGNVRAPVGGIWNATVGPHGHHVAIGQGGDIRLWDTRTKQEIEPRLPGSGRTTETLAFTNDGDHLFAIGDNDRFTLFDIASNHVLRGFSGPFGAIAMSPDEKNIVSCGDGLIVWDVESGLPVITLSDAADGDFVAVDWSIDNRRIAAARMDGTVHIWTLPTKP